MSAPYLDDGDILIVNKTLACALGLNESIVLRQLHYWIELNRKAESERHFRDGCWWAFNTYGDWCTEDFPFWSTDTVRRAIIELESMGLVEAGNYNTRKGDQTKWYTINYARYEAFLKHWREHNCPNVSNRTLYKEYQPVWQVAMTSLASCIGQLGNLHRPLPETTTKTTTKKNTPLPPKGADRKRTPKPSEEESFRIEYQQYFLLAEALRKPFMKMDIDAVNMPRAALQDYLDAAKQLTPCGATPDETPALYAYVKERARREEWKTFGVKALVKYYPDFKAQGYQVTSPPTAGDWQITPAPALPIVNTTLEERQQMVAESRKQRIGGQS